MSCDGVNEFRKIIDTLPKSFFITYFCHSQKYPFMQEARKITNALISVFNKEGIEPFARALESLGLNIYSTGGTHEFIEKLGITVHAVENLTGYPGILGGRVKTLHPKIFGGILARRANETDQKEMEEF